MRIPINKDIEEAYKDQFIRGFSVRETCYIGLSLAIMLAVGAAVFFWFGLPINFCAYIGLPFGIPTLIIGFKKFQGLTLTEYIKELIYENKTKELFYDADEIPENKKVYKMERETQTKKKKKRGR